MFKVLNYQLGLSSPIGPDEETYKKRLEIAKDIFNKKDERKLYINTNNATPESFYILYNPDTEMTDRITLQRKAMSVYKGYDFGKDIENIDINFVENDILNVNEFLNENDLETIANLTLSFELLYYDESNEIPMKLFNYFQHGEKILKNSLISEYLNSYNSSDYNIRLILENYLKNTNYLFINSFISFKIDMFPLSKMKEFFTFSIDDVSKGIDKMKNKISDL